MSSIKTFLAVLVVTAFSLAACSHPRHEGPAERAGQKMDKGFEKMGEKMESAGQKMQEKARGD
jgi:hypothetical protein